MKLSSSIAKATPLFKIFTILLLIFLPLVGFATSKNYQEKIANTESELEISA